MHVLAQDSGGGLLPEWLADAPSWLQALALVLALGAALGTLTAPVWGPALADRIRGRSAPTPPPDSSGDPPVSTTTKTSAPAPEERYDAKMAVIERLLENVERDQERDREEADRLKSRIAQLEADVRTRDATIAARDATIADLRRMVDQLLGQPRQGPPPPTPWPDLGPGRSPGN